MLQRGTSTTTSTHHQEEDKKLFEELKQGKTSGDSRPTFKNSAKQYNKEEQNTP
jgi:hypothetical protein